MVFRKPYAFLIKNFKKIHILLLALCGYVYYKLFVLLRFIKEFIVYGTYNKNLEGISTKIGSPVYLSIVLIILITIAIMVLLIYKKKPWKLYLVILVNYIVMIYGLILVTNFFNSFSVTDTTTGVLLPRDIVNITSILQYPTILIILMRIIGLDIKKFKFNTDEEFIELNSKDREEFEVNIEIDKDSFKRTYKKLIRNIGYVYQEHKYIINTIIIILVIALIGYSYYYFGIKHKKYKQGELYSVGIYDIKVEDTFITDKDATGEVLEKDNKFVIVRVYMKNKSDQKVDPNFKRFHLMNRSINKTSTLYYDDVFDDMGRGISKDNTLNSNEEKEFMLVYKVPKDLKNKNFVMYYQEYNGQNKTYVRKIKLKIKDVSRIETTEKYNLEENINFKLLNDKEEQIALEEASFENTITYNRYICESTYDCHIKEINLPARKGERILKIVFNSSEYEGKEFVDFTSQYGIIKYVDNDSKEHSIEVKNSIDTEYEGKEIYLSVPEEVATAKEVYIDYKIRNKEYIVKVK